VGSVFFGVLGHNGRSLKDAIEANAATIPPMRKNLLVELGSLAFNSDGVTK